MMKEEQIDTKRELCQENWRGRDFDNKNKIGCGIYKQNVCVNFLQHQYMGQATMASNESWAYITRTPNLKPEFW